MPRFWRQELVRGDEWRSCQFADARAQALAEDSAILGIPPEAAHGANDSVFRETFQISAKLLVGPSISHSSTGDQPLLAYTYNQKGLDSCMYFVAFQRQLLTKATSAEFVTGIDAAQHC